MPEVVKEIRRLRRRPKGVSRRKQGVYRADSGINSVQVLDPVTAPLVFIFAILSTTCFPLMYKHE
jgi:hypothetical protein